VPTLQAKVTPAWEAATAVEATRIVVVLATETSAQEAATAWDSAALRVKDAKDQDTLVEREAWESVLRVEVESTVTLASAHEDVEGLVQKIALLEGELAEERQAQELAEEYSQGLSDAAADIERWWEVSERERQEQFKELILLQT
jgi:hypothetical protein